MGTPRFRLLPATLDPPALSADDFVAAAEEENLPWGLLELEAYVADRKNATTAYSQVTFFVRRPPHLFYLCVYSADAEIPVGPQILATEDDLVLLRIIVRCQEDVVKNIDYYVYQADDGSGQPSLHHLPRPPCRCSFDARDIGILRPQRSGDKDEKSYIVAGLVRDEQYEDFVLYLFDSEKKAWTTNPVSLNHQQKQQYHHGICRPLAGGVSSSVTYFQPPKAKPCRCFVTSQCQHAGTPGTMRATLGTSPSLKVISSLSSCVLHQEKQNFQGSTPQRWLACCYMEQSGNMHVAVKDTWCKDCEVGYMHSRISKYLKKDPSNSV